MVFNILLYLFLVCLAVQLFIYLFIFSKLLRHPITEEVNSEKPPVSIIIAAHNEASNLKEFLPAILNQKYPEYEIIVANDRSSDETENNILAFQKEFPRLNLVNIEETPEHLNSKKYALTLAIKAAKYDNLLFTDADCKPQSDQWLSLMCNRLDQNKTQFVLGYSPYFEEKGILNHYIRFETLYTAIQYLSFALAKMPYMGVGRNLAYKKSLFISNNGFEEFYHLTGGDDDLFVNKHASESNTTVCIGKKSTTRSIPKQIWKEYWVQKRRHLAAGKFYKAKDKTRIGIVTLSQILFWFTLIPLTFTGKEQYLVLAGFLLRTLIQSFTFKKASQKLGDKVNVWLIPFLDLIFVVFYTISGLNALISKKIKWA